MKRAYILGPMTGYPEENRPAFQEASRFLRKLGYVVLSPDEFDQAVPPATQQWSDFLRRDLPFVATAEVGVALKGWRSSKGATLEATILTALGVPIFELEGQALWRLEPGSCPVPSHPT